MLCGCSAVLDIPDDPELVAPSGRACIDPTVRTSTATVRMYACDFVADCDVPVRGLSARLCRKRDVGCSEPIREGITDADGLLVFDVMTGDTGFDGYLEVTSDSALCTDQAVFGAEGRFLCDFLPGCDPEAPDEACRLPLYAPALFFFNPPVRADITEPIQLPLLKTSALPSVVEAAGADFDPTAGNLFITSLDCSGFPAAGVSYDIAERQEEVTALYIASGVVSGAEQRTDGSGVGGFVGVPPGFVEVIGLDEDMGVIGEIGVQTAPFTLTYGAIGPF